MRRADSCVVKVVFSMCCRRVAVRDLLAGRVSTLLLVLLFVVEVENIIQCNRSEAIILRVSRCFIIQLFCTALCSRCGRSGGRLMSKCDGRTKDRVGRSGARRLGANSTMTQEPFV